MAHRFLLPALLALCVVLCLAACGDDDGPRDATTDGTDDAGELSPAAPPSPPVLTPCPAGWTESTLRDAVTVCLPFGDAAASDCPPGQLQLPGVAGCEDIGTACPAPGEWAPDLPADRAVVYVDAGASGGDGTRASPFGSIWEGLRAASGGIVALTARRYDEAVFVDDGATLWGACTRDTILTNTSALAVPTFLIRGSGGGLRNMTVGEDPRLGVHIIGGVGELQSVEIRGAAEFGLRVSSSELSGSRIAIRDIGSDPTTGLGRGMQVEYGGTAMVDGLVIERVIATGIWIGNVDTRATLTNVSVRDVSPYQTTGRAGRFGRGVDVIEGAAVTLSRGIVANVHEVGAGADGLGASLSLRDVRIEDVKSRMSGQLDGRSTSAQLGAALSLERVSIARSRASAVALHGPDADVTLGDVVIDGVRGADLDGASSRAIEAFEAGVIGCARVAILDGGGFGMLLGDVGSSAIVEDLFISGLAGDGANGTHGHGVQAQRGASVELTRARVASSRGFGAVALSGASLTGWDLRIEDVQPWTCAESGCADGASFANGVGAFADATVVLGRFDIRNAALCGLYVGEGANADASMGEVRTCEIGACIRDGAFDVERISSEVRYRDNGTNLDARTLPVPAAAESLGAI